jgi:hypothetical protein
VGPALASEFAALEQKTKRIEQKGAKAFSVEQPLVFCEDRAVRNSEVPRMRF